MSPVLSDSNYESLMNALRERERDVYLELFRAQGVVAELREELNDVQKAIIETQREHFGSTQTKGSD